MKQLSEYTDLELKAIAIEEREKIDVATQNLSIIRQELAKRAKAVEVPKN